MGKIKIENDTASDEVILIGRGINELEAPDGDRQYVQLFDTAGKTIFHGMASVVRVEVVAPRRKEA